MKVAFIAALALAPALAVGQSAHRPEISTGDRWAFAEHGSVPSATPTRTWIVTAVTSEGIEGTDNGEPLRLTRELNVLDSARESASNMQALRFPLEVGKRWTYSTDWHLKAKGSRGTADGEAIVVAYETVRVPAGTFEAFKIVRKDRIHGTSPVGSQYGGAEATATYWYAPDARAIVKLVAHNPYLGTRTVELVEYGLGGTGGEAEPNC